MEKRNWLDGKEKVEFVSNYAIKFRRVIFVIEIVGCVRITL